MTINRQSILSFNMQTTNTGYAVPRGVPFSLGVVRGNKPAKQLLILRLNENAWAFTYLPCTPHESPGGGVLPLAGIYTPMLGRRGSLLQCRPSRGTHFPGEYQPSTLSLKRNATFLKLPFFWRSVYLMTLTLGPRKNSRRDVAFLLRLSVPCSSNAFSVTGCHNTIWLFWENSVFMFHACKRHLPFQL